MYRPRNLNGGFPRLKISASELVCYQLGRIIREWLNARSPAVPKPALKELSNAFEGTSHELLEEAEHADVEFREHLRSQILSASSQTVSVYVPMLLRGGRPS